MVAYDGALLNMICSLLVIALISTRSFTGWAIMSEAACTPILSRLRRQYLSLYPSRLIAKQLAQLPPTDLALACHQPWIIERMLSGYQVDGSSQVAVDRYAPALDYQLGFWKMIVDRLEVELATDQAQEEELVGQRRVER